MFRYSDHSVESEKLFALDLTDFYFFGGKPPHMETDALVEIIKNGERFPSLIQISGDYSNNNWLYSVIANNNNQPLNQPARNRQIFAVLTWLIEPQRG